MKRQRRFYFWALIGLIGLINQYARADAYDPPAAYYDTAIGTGATLKGQLNNIIDNVDDPGISDEVHTPVSYDALRSALQVTDADPSNPSHMLLVYNRVSLNVAAINPGGSIPGWDNGVTWNREHSWPQSRGLDSTGSPDGSDLHHLRPATTSVNTDRENLNFGGAYGAQSFGEVTETDENNNTYTAWYPGNADAGMIARHQFYMAVRYDGTQASTTNLELGTGDVPDVSGGTDPPPQLGDLTSLIEWHFAAPPDMFERRRNQAIYDNYQNNRNPFIDRPEYMWSIFVNQANDSQLSIAGSTVNANGSSTRNLDLGRVFVGAAIPAAQAFTLNKSGSNGTYFEVTTTGAATSSLSGRFNAMRTNQTDTKSINVGLNTSTATAGVKTGAVTIDNLDITTGGGTGRGANDANDAFNVSVTVLDHATPSFTSPALTTTLNHNFGNIALGDGAPALSFSIYNLLTTAANMDFDSVTPSGNASAFSTNLAASAGVLSIPGGGSQMFTASIIATTVGTFNANYTLNFSDENIAGALNKPLTLSLTGTLRLAGDYNGDLAVDAADYTVWRNNIGQSGAAYSGADGDGSGTITSDDYNVWRAHFGQTAMAGGASLISAVPEPGGIFPAVMSLAAIVWFSGRAKVFSRRQHA